MTKTNWMEQFLREETEFEISTNENLLKLENMRKNTEELKSENRIRQS